MIWHIVTGLKSFQHESTAGRDGCKVLETHQKRMSMYSSLSHQV